MNTVGTWMILPLSDERHQEIRSIVEGYLAIAERRFGPRVPHEIVGIEVTNGDPKVIACNLRSDGTVPVLLFISNRAAVNDRLLRRELSHEAIHLLCTASKTTTVLEEALATAFQRACSEDDDTVFIPIKDYSNYERAVSAFAPYLSRGDDLIKRLRERHPRLTNITRNELRELYADMADDGITYLLSSFVY